MRDVPQTHHFGRLGRLTRSSQLTRSNQLSRHGSRNLAPVFESRSGSVSGLLLFGLLSFMLVVALSVAALNLNQSFGSSNHDVDKVRIYCAASVAKPAEKVVTAFNEKFDLHVEIVRIGGSGELAGQIKMESETGVKNGADLFLSADDMLMGKAMQEGIFAKRFPVAQQRPVIAVRSGSPLKVSSLQELVSTPCKFGVASKRAAIGKMVRDIAAEHGVLSLLESQKATDAENVMTLAQGLTTGSLDVAIVWDTTVSQINAAAKSDVLRIASMADPGHSKTSRIEIGIVSSSIHSATADKFCNFLSGSRESRDAFQSFGFTANVRQAVRRTGTSDPSKRGATASKASLL